MTKDIFSGGEVLPMAEHDGDPEWRPGGATYRDTEYHAPGFYQWKAKHGLLARLRAQAKKEHSNGD